MIANVNVRAPASHLPQPHAGVRRAHVLSLFLRHPVRRHLFPPASAPRQLGGAASWARRRFLVLRGPFVLPLLLEGLLRGSLFLLVLELHSGLEAAERTISIRTVTYRDYWRCDGVRKE